MKKVFKKTSVKNLSPYYQFGIDYFGPFLYGFTKWLYTSLKKAQIHRVYFFSRDGYMMDLAFQQLGYDAEFDTLCPFFTQKSETSVAVYNKWVSGFVAVFGMGEICYTF